MSDSNGKRIAVIGAGPGGYPAAFEAAHLGFDVTLIDTRENPGGVCLYVGCIPSKALLHVAKLVNEAAEAKAWGVDFGEPKIDIDKVRAFKDKVVKKMTGGLGQMSKAHKITFVKGRAAFNDANSVTVTDNDGKTSTVAFDYAIIATGSRPAMPKMFDVGSDRVMDSTGALELPDIPQSLLVVGGGYIGMEMGSVYAALGSKVTVVEMMKQILPGADPDLAEALHKHAKKKFEAILTDTRVTEMSKDKKGIKVKLLGLDINNEERVYDRVIVSVGRIPNSQNLGLENVPGVKVGERGFIEVDAQRRTGADNIYAIGDVAGEPGLAHKATHEGLTAAKAIAGEPVAFDPACIPAVVFTDPEVAWVGLTETECLNRNIPHSVSTFPWAASGRAATLGRSDGLTKLIFSPLGDRLLGMGLVGVGAGDLIAEGALAIEMGATAIDLAHTIHPHPTTSETIMEAADLHLGFSAHYIPRKKR
ncbi:MAG: dihydrolipoyl dehydrogenase [Phycisphaera sp.]|nr:dihydrolipoyl dehydrogenase [Phycisphaera sp.]